MPDGAPLPELNGRARPHSVTSNRRQTTPFMLTRAIAMTSSGILSNRGVRRIFNCYSAYCQKHCWRQPLVRVDIQRHNVGDCSSRRRCLWRDMDAAHHHPPTPTRRWRRRRRRWTTCSSCHGTKVETVVSVGLCDCARWDAVRRALAQAARRIARRYSDVRALSW